MDLKNKKILVVGLGRTGFSLATFLNAQGARVTVSDTATETELRDNVDILKQLGIRMQLGEHQSGAFTEADLILLSPGVPHTIRPIRIAEQKGIPVWGEIEFAARFIEQPMAAVTGTNGKTTTTTLLGEMLRQSGMDVFVGGNIGSPLIGYVEKGQTAQAVVIEISSFQLDTITSFAPRVAVLLNISEDHLDRYPDFNAYVQSKERIFKYQRSPDIAVVNNADPLARDIGNRLKGNVWYVNPQPDQNGATIELDRIVFRTPVAAPFAIDLADVHLTGGHNLENAAAAGLAAIAMGGTAEGCRSALKVFKGLPHRQELVSTVNGVRFVNDSKATNVDAVIRALEAYTDPIILILGGRDKGGDFAKLMPLIQEKVKQVILTGEAAGRIADALGPAINARKVPTLNDAVHQAREIAVTGDMVLLSPGCTSFDRYRNYEERGEDFRTAVDELDRESA